MPERQSLSNTVKCLQAVSLAALLKRDPCTSVPEPAVCRYFTKYMFLNNSQNSQKSTCAGVFFNDVADPENCNFIKKRLQHRFFPVNFVNYSRTPILQRIYERLVLKHQCSFLRTLFLQNMSIGCFWKFQVSSLQLYLKRDSSKDVYL